MNALKTVYETEKNAASIVVRGPVPRILCLNQDLQDVQDFQDGGCSDALAASVCGARAFVSHGAKVWKTLMSIARRRKKA